MKTDKQPSYDIDGYVGMFIASSVLLFGIINDILKG